MFALMAEAQFIVICASPLLSEQQHLTFGVTGNFRNFSD